MIGVRNKMHGGRALWAVPKKLEKSFKTEGYGGARRSRTADLLNAIQALSQLSYGPFREQWSVIGNQKQPSINLITDY